MSADRNPFAVSTEKLPEPGSRADFVARLSEMCHEVCELARHIHSGRNERMLGRLEERIYTKVDEIHRIQREAYLDHGFNIVVSHTAEGLPVRVNSISKRSLWGD